MFHLTSSVAYLAVNQFNCIKFNYAIHAMLKALQFKPKAHGTRARELCHDLLLHLVKPHGVFMICIVQYSILISCNLMIHELFE